jgi:hypothetical protein
MRKADFLLGLLLVACVVSALELLSEPYYHQCKVNFWVWARREIIELNEGEK